MVIDYSKAFDTIEWEFINNTLFFLNFDKLISMVKLLQTGAASKIEQNGYFSKKIVLERGCRQGDPVSPYLFVLGAEILSTVIRECGDVKGLGLGDREVKISLYADNTTFFLKSDKKYCQKSIGHISLV